MCSIGQFLEDSCTPDFRAILEEDEKKLVSCRTGCEIVEDICEHHKQEYLTFYSMRQKSCCDPLKKHPTATRKKGLRYIDQTLVTKYSQVLNLIPGKKICDSCRKALPKWLEDNSGPAHWSPSSEEEISRALLDDEEVFLHGEMGAGIESVNSSLALIGESPVDRGKLLQKRYPEEKLGKINKTMKRQLRFMTNDGSGVEEDSSEEDDTDQKHSYNEVMVQLKEKFNKCSKPSEKIQILTILPRS